MPLFIGKKNVGRNISLLIKEGRPRKQAIAIALDKVDNKPKKRRRSLLV